MRQVHRFFYHLVVGPDATNSPSAADTLRSSLDIPYFRADKLANAVARVLKDGLRLTGGI